MPGYGFVLYYSAEMCAHNYHNSSSREDVGKSCVDTSSQILGYKTSKLGFNPASHRMLREFNRYTMSGSNGPRLVCGIAVQQIVCLWF